MMRPLVLVVLAALVLPALAGCLTGEPLSGAAVDPIRFADLDTSRGWSMPRSPGLYDMLPAVKAFVPSFDGVEMAIGIFLPDIEGCDWEAEALPDACRLPIVMDAGPYYGAVVDVDKYRPPTIEWLVPRGYGVVQMSLRGTGESGGCLEFKNPQDVDDVSAVLTWLSEQAWSNGNLGMTGRSYDGTSAWAGAASGNPALKAIMPISGAVDGPFLYFKNGTSEVRAPINGATYFPGYATDAKPMAEWSERLCEGALVEIHRETLYGTLTGDASAEFWQARDLRGAILQNYRGAVWVVHGLHDWNVNPSQAVPFINDMQDAGIDVQAWLGVWGHHYPDRVDEHRNVRWDWAERTVRFFDKHLKGADVDTGPRIEVEDNLFVWRAEESYPPRDADWQELFLSSGGALGEPAGGTAIIRGGASATFASQPFEMALRVAGLPQLHVTVTPTTTQGGYVFAELYDVWPDGRSMRLGWAAIDLRHHAGGNTDPQTLVPGQPVVARMQFEPMDALIAKGHSLRLVVHKESVEDILSSPSPEVNVLTLGEASALRLPVIERQTVVPSYVPPRID